MKLFINGEPQELHELKFVTCKKHGEEYCPLLGGCLACEEEENEFVHDWIVPGDPLTGMMELWEGGYLYS